MSSPSSPPHRRSFAYSGRVIYACRRVSLSSATTQTMHMLYIHNKITCTQAYARVGWCSETIYGVCRVLRDPFQCPPPIPFSSFWRDQTTMTAAHRFAFACNTLEWPYFLPALPPPPPPLLSALMGFRRDNLYVIMRIICELFTLSNRPAVNNFMRHCLFSIGRSFRRSRQWPFMMMRRPFFFFLLLFFEYNIIIQCRYAEIS